MRRIVAELQVYRLGPVAAGAVLCPERAYGRVVEWRRKTGASAAAPPPMELLRALVHTGSSIPTLVASSGDHFWLLALNRWATPAELMSLFGVPPWAAVRCLVDPDDDTPALTVACCLGRAVQPHCAEVALRVALRGALGRRVVESREPIRYVSACSGIDLFGVALDHLLGTEGWRYHAASEKEDDIAAALVRAYGTRGLSMDHVMVDATSREACEWGPYADLWVCTPPRARPSHAATTSARTHGPSTRHLSLISCCSMRATTAPWPL